MEQQQDKKQQSPIPLTQQELETIRKIVREEVANALKIEAETIRLIVSEELEKALETIKSQVGVLYFAKMEYNEIKARQDLKAQQQES